MALLAESTRKKYFKELGLGEYNKSNIKKLQKKYFSRQSDIDGIYGTDTDNLLRHVYNVKNSRCQAVYHPVDGRGEFHRGRFRRVRLGNAARRSGLPHRLSIFFPMGIPAGRRRSGALDRHLPFDHARGLRRIDPVSAARFQFLFRAGLLRSRAAGRYPGAGRSGRRRAEMHILPDHRR